LPAAAQVLADNPSFLHRIPDYYGTTDDFVTLPVDIQTAMTIGGGGGGQGFRAGDGRVIDDFYAG